MEPSYKVERKLKYQQNRAVEEKEILKQGEVFKPTHYAGGDKQNSSGGQMNL